MTIPQGIKHLLRQPSEADIIFFKKDRTFPFSIRAGIINAYRRQARRELGIAIQGPSRQNRVYKKQEALHPRYPRVARSFSRSTPSNCMVRNTCIALETTKSRGRNRVSVKRVMYFKSVPMVVHRKGSKEDWSKDNG